MWASELVERARPEGLASTGNGGPLNDLMRHLLQRGLEGELTEAQLAASPAEFWRGVADGPFYGFNRPGVEGSAAVSDNWWRQAMMGAVNAHYDCVRAFAEEDYSSDLEGIQVPVLVMHDDDDQIVPYASTAPRAAELLRNGTLKTYIGFPHGMPTTQADTINADLLAFIQS